MANAILVQAVNNDGDLSKPFKVFVTKEDTKLSKRFPLRVDEKVNNNGDDQLRVSNYALGLIASHGAEWMENTLTGYRRQQEDQVFIVVERLKDDMPSVSKLIKEETF